MLDLEEQSIGSIVSENPSSQQDDDSEEEEEQ